MATKRCMKVGKIKPESKSDAKREIEQLINGIKKKLEEKDSANKAALIIEELIKKQKK